MRKSLVSLLSLIALWSLFYAGFKYFFWWVYEHSSFTPTLEEITGYILIGSTIAYLVGGPLYAKLSEWFMLFCSTGIGIFFFLIATFLPSISPYFFDVSMAGLGFAYSLYVIGKNTLISREISTSNLGSSSIGAFATVVFIVFLIVGTIAGAKIWESVSLHNFGIFYFLVLMLLTVGVLAITNTRREKTDFVFSLALYKKLFIRYGIFMIGLGCFWQISVEASQVAINYSKDFFDKSNSVSSLLLLFSSVGAILGNILSVKLSKNRLSSFLGMTGIFVAVIVLFSTILSVAKSMDNYAIIQVLAFAVGFFFGGAVNLAESHFFALLGEDIEKDYVSALYGFTLSLVGAVTMFVSEKILQTGSYFWISVFLGILAIVALYWGRRGILMK